MCPRLSLARFLSKFLGAPWTAYLIDEVLGLLKELAEPGMIDFPIIRFFAIVRPAM